MLGIFDDVAKVNQRTTDEQVEGIEHVHLLASIWAEVHLPPPAPPLLVSVPRRRPAAA